MMLNIALNQGGCIPCFQGDHQMHGCQFNAPSSCVCMTPRIVQKPNIAIKTGNGSKLTYSNLSYITKRFWRSHEVVRNINFRNIIFI